LGVGQKRGRGKFHLPGTGNFQETDKPRASRCCEGKKVALTSTKEAIKEQQKKEAKESYARKALLNPGEVSAVRSKGGVPSIQNRKPVIE